MNYYILETARLGLREFTINDTNFIIQLLNSPGWIEFIGDRNIRTAEQAKQYLLSGPIKSYQKNGFGLSLVELKIDKTAIGMCGMIKRENLENPDIGFAFLPEFTGKGFAFEIAKATIIFAKDKLKLSHVLAITKPENGKSIKLLERIGLKFKKTFAFPGSTEEVMLFSNQ